MLTKDFYKPLYVGPMSVIAEDYIRYTTDVKRLSMMTIKRYRCIISLFTQKMSLQQINWDTLKYSHILDFLSSRNNTEPILYACIRNLLHFAYLNGKTQDTIKHFYNYLLNETLNFKSMR